MKNPGCLNVLLWTASLLFCHLLTPNARAQFFSYTRSIPQQDPTGAQMPGANTTFADGSTFKPAGDTARSSSWTWRPYGDQFILSSLGPGTTTLPTNTKELVTTVTGLKPGAQYEVRALFWSAESALWGVRAGLNYAYGSRTNQWFNNTNSGVVLAHLLAWGTNMPGIFREGGRNLYAAPLGVTTANANGQIKVYIHDLPSSNSDIRTWYQGVAVGIIPGNEPFIVDAGSPGMAFPRGVRGLALADVAITRGEYHVGIPRSLEVARGSAIRGVATGLAADLYDWRVRNGQPRPPTLQFLRYSRDYQAELWLGANVRGLVEPDPAGGFRYYDTNTSTLAVLAADWVRYVNHIVPTYRQGDTITDPRDAAILNSLVWSSAEPGDSFDKLLAPGEAPVPLVQYWEIGNEPTIGVGAFSVNDSYTLQAPEYHARYGAVAKAIKAENPTVKVGPTLVHGGREAAHLAALAADSSLPLDFVTYHPYERMGELTDPALITLHLGSVYSRQLFFYNEIRNILAQNGRDPAQIEYATTEVNVSSWDTNDTDKEARIAHALGTVESVFTHARFGLAASHYWIWPTHRWDGTEYPVFKAYQKLRDHMGDTLLGVHALPDVRLYTTRDSRSGQIAVWILNFSETNDSVVDLRLLNLPSVKSATLHRLQHSSGRTSLLSLNSSSEMPGGRAIHVDWTSSSLDPKTLSNHQINSPAATLSVIVLQPGVEDLKPSITEENGQRTFSITFEKISYASDLRYRLLRSDDLLTWMQVAEKPADPSGEVSFADQIPADHPAKRFYRVEPVP